MSIERPVTNPATGEELTVAEALLRSPEEQQKLREEKKAKLARILDRGIVADRLAVELPPELYGEWVHNSTTEVHRMRTLGFEIDTEYATKRALHDQGDNRSVVGDVVFMICDRENKEILDEIRRENFERINGKPGEVRTSQKEEQDFKSATERHGLPVIDESRDRAARKAELQAALQKAQAEVAAAQPKPKGVIHAGTIIK